MTHNVTFKYSFCIFPFSVKGIKSTRKLKKSQLCAGWKIPEDGTKPKIFEYRTKGKDERGFVIYDFKEIKSTSIHKNKKDWDRYEDKVKDYFK